MPRPRNRPEEDLHRSVADYLDLALPSDAIWWHTPNQRGTRKAWENKLLKALGVRAGFPDIAILWRGHLYCIELKSSTGRASKEQQELMDRLRQSGASVTICRTLDAVEIALGFQWGFPLRAKVAA